MLRKNSKHKLVFLTLIAVGIFLLPLLNTAGVSGNFDSDPSIQANRLFTEKMSFGPPSIKDNNAPLDKLNSNQETIANCRYGVVGSDNQFSVIPTLGAGLVLKFSTPYWSESGPANDAEKIHLIKTHQLKTVGGEYLPGFKTNFPLDDTLANYIQNHPGDMWLIGNEVDRGPQPGQTTGGQGDMFPEIYAQAYHDVRSFIKKNDPTARIAISGLVEVTPGRLQYLDQVWNAYQQKYGAQMPVDVWNMHVYVLPEVEPDGVTPNGIANVALGTIPSLGKRGSGGDPNACSDPNVYCYAEHDNIEVFAEQVVAMRQWMKAHGQQQKPLLLSEFSILYPYIDDGGSCFLQDEFGNCFTPTRIKTFMNNTFDYLEGAKNANLGYGHDDNRLVQQWIWFSIRENSVGSSSNLTQADFLTLTELGQNFHDRVYAQPLYVNLRVSNVPNQVAVVDGSGQANALLSVKFLNNGNNAVAEPFTVTFYKDAALTEVIGSVMVPSMLRGCATDYYEAAVEWPDLDPGHYEFWVHLDSDNVIAEYPDNEVDNIGKGTVLVNTDMVALPIVIR